MPARNRSRTQGLAAANIAMYSQAVVDSQGYDYSSMLEYSTRHCQDIGHFQQTVIQPLTTATAVRPSIATAAASSLPLFSVITAITAARLPLSRPSTWKQYSLFGHVYGNALSAFAIIPLPWPLAFLGGGGVTVNYMVFVVPSRSDFDDKWPKGCKWNDVAPAASRLAQRYDHGLCNSLSGFFDRLGWRSVDMIKQPDEKHQIYSSLSWNSKKSLRRKNLLFAVVQGHPSYQIRLTSCWRQVETYGKEKIIKLRTAAFFSARAHISCLLFNSDAVPNKQILTAKKTGVTLRETRSTCMLTTDSVLNGTDAKNVNLYEKKSYKIVIFVSSKNGPGNGIASIKVYVTHGLLSPGVLGLAEGKTVIDKSPYLQTDGDVGAAKAFVQDMVEKITGPSAGSALRKDTNTAAIIKAVTSGNHYAGIAKTGAIVDTNANVYGTDNLESVFTASLHKCRPFIY
ncbi:hypothetical protein UVI_02000610 [Ustilaginoidea virens]|uniref:Cellobiose dehydrogenase n=1 Tax=Ustilaginoidea virens TaxID=1159556 RepID=A0A1B5L4L3_USTVR|nr:hypothetical protein UVI_02000610 [Ustilaginoidea virens]